MTETTAVPELALPILLHQVVHFSDTIITQDVDRLKNWEALEYFWKKVPQEYKDGSDGSDDLFGARYSMCKVLIASTTVDPYDGKLMINEQNDTTDIIPFPPPPLINFTKDMWEALIELMNSILLDIKGNEKDRTFKGIVCVRRAIHAQIVLADFRDLIEHYANQGANNDVETCEIREQLRNCAAAVLHAAQNECAADAELAEILKQMVERPNPKTRTGRKKAGHDYVQFVAADQMREILNSKPFDLNFVRHEINKVLLEWGSDTFQSVATAVGIQDAMANAIQQVEPAVETPAPTTPPTTTAIVVHPGSSTTGTKSAGGKRKVKHKGAEIEREPNQVMPPPIVIKQNGNRKKMRFSDVEKEAIRQGVLKYGVGKWAQIKAGHEVTLRNRTSVNIKDCYRTMCKRNEFQSPSAAPAPPTPPSTPALT